MSKSVLHQILDRTDFSPRTKEKYKLIIDRWIDFAGGDSKHWTRDRAQDFYDQLIEGGVKPQSANVYLASLRYVSKWYATKQGNPALDFAIVQKRRPKGKARTDSPVLDEHEAEQLIRSCSTDDPIDRRDRAMIIVGLETGMRRMSLQGMTFEGLTFKHDYPAMTVPIKGEGGEETFEVPLSDVAWGILSNWTAWLRQHRIKSGPVFRNLDARGASRALEYVPGESLSLSAINKIIGERAEAAGIRHVNPHMLRHTFITWRTAMGFSPFDIAAMTGHEVKLIAVGGVQINSGAMAGYIHQGVERIRNSTPLWLKALVVELLTIDVS